MMIFLIFITAVFFALNMGSTSFAASYATAFGGNILSKRSSALLFIIFVLLGAIVLGDKVSMTLGKGIVTQEFIDQKAIFIIFLTAGISMFTANILHIPQSTSLVAVGAISGVGLHYQALNVSTILYLIPFWFILPLLSFAITLFFAYGVYPPRKQNFWFYEKFANHERKLKIFVIGTCCYNAFSVGTNNVANVVGPILSFRDESIVLYLILFGIIYGLGSLIFSKTLKTVSKEIVPLGLLTSSIIAVVSGSLMILASYFGVPQSFVMLQMGAIFAISVVKEGKYTAFKSPILRKSIITWIINPLITFAISYAMVRVLLQ